MDRNGLVMDRKLSFMQMDEEDMDNTLEFLYHLEKWKMINAQNRRWASKNL